MKWTLIVLPALFWAMSDIVARYAAKGTNVYLASAITTIIMAIIFTFLFFFTETNPLQTIFETKRSYIWAFILSGLTNVVGGWAYFQFLATGGNFTGELGSITLLNLIFLLIFGILFWKDPLSAKNLLGLAFGLVAIYLLS